jgi:SAM-dependent methyltransferase
VWTGFFPDDLPKGSRFDVIVFNDVFEHLPDLPGALRAILSFLSPNGVLVLNIPNSEGFFYRIASFLDRIGYRSPLERLWQKEFPSPHLAYFNPVQLRRFIERFGMHSIHSSSLDSVKLRALWARLRYDRTAPFLSSVFAYVAVVLCFPFLKLFPSDISLEMYGKAK